jgi:hypothetical protein
VTQTAAWKVKHKSKQVTLERDATKRFTDRVEIAMTPISVVSAPAASGVEGRPARRRLSSRSRRCAAGGSCTFPDTE